MPKLVEKLIAGILDAVRLRKKQVDYPYILDNQPRLILLRPVPRPAFCLLNPELYKTTRRKFSTDLEEITHHYRVQLVNLDELNCSQRVLFNEFGNLSDYGIERFWKSLSDFFRRSDRDEYNAIKLFRVHKKSVGTQTYTQQKKGTDTQSNPNQANQQLKNPQLLPQQTGIHHHQVQPHIPNLSNQVQQGQQAWYNHNDQTGYHQASGDYNRNYTYNNQHMMQPSFSNQSNFNPNRK